MVQLPIENDPREIVKLLLKSFDALTERFPHSWPTDVLCAATYARVNLFGDLLPRKQAIRESHLQDAFFRLLVALHKHAQRRLREAGRPTDESSYASLCSFFYGFYIWLKGVHLPAMRAGSQSERRVHAKEVWLSLSADAEAEGHFPHAQAKGAMRAALRRAGVKESDHAATIGALEKMSKSGEPRAITHLNSDGKQRVSDRSIVDGFEVLSAMRTDTRREKRQAKRHRQLRRVEELADIAARLGQRGLTEAADGEVVRKETLGVIRDVCEKRAVLPCRANAPALRAVRNHLYALIIRELTQLEVATRYGVRQPAIAKQLEREREAVYSEVRRRMSA